MRRHTIPQARVAPQKDMALLSRREIARLLDAGQGTYNLFRRCALAVLNSGSITDDTEALMQQYQDFDIRVLQQDRGVKLEIENAPGHAFVDGEMIEGTREMLFAVLRDIVYTQQLLDEHAYDLATSEGITDTVFSILRHSAALKPGREPRLVVCWGGHSISRVEYDYTKDVGYEMGLRGLDICTGCGPGAMKGPMKGATIAHSKQRIKDGRYIGISEPGIIAAESPNPIVNELIIMPDIEKRLEAFVRLGHGIVVFPGGVGTAEEILYLLGILMHPENADIPFPVILTGPASSAAYFHQIDAFIRDSLGDKVSNRYRIIIDDPAEVARQMERGIGEVHEARLHQKDAFFFNWMLHIDSGFQQPFAATHKNMSSLNIHKNQPAHELAANLRRAFSGIVAGNVKPEGLRAIAKHGLFEINGDPDIMEPLDALLAAFVKDQRMKLPGTDYKPCYKVVAKSRQEKKAV